ncbi:hypothetical protein QJS10_CPA08g00189 [Acorus calamus]|uniref:CCHC-type domain-containing protein n=1 Tax=Acorus calamus TaxID=4465 RepID=A0AAV9EGL7_ACOCL|nr:hypothetical protein QJS10_CPA08g00189 [Acorus calamus]
MKSTANSLSELVWSPQKGLSVKSTDCSLAEKKSSLFWCSDSGNLMFSPPRSTKGWEGSVNAPLAAELNLSSSNLASNSAGDNSDPGAIIGSPKLSACISPICQKKNLDQHPGPSQALGLVGSHVCLEGSNCVADASVKHINYVDLSAKRENNESCSSRTLQMFVGFQQPQTDVLVCLPGIDNETVTYDKDAVKQKGPSPAKESGLGIDIVRAQILALDTLSVEQYRLSKNLKCASENIEEHRNKIGVCSHHLGVQSSDARSDGWLSCHPPPTKLVSKIRCDCPELDMALSPKPLSEIEESTGKKHLLRQKEKAPLVEASPINSRGHLNMEKEKGADPSDNRVGTHSTNEKTVSHESVESTNTGSLLTNRKRVLSFEKNLLIESKRIKQQSQEHPSPVSFLNQGSSFMNWISNMTKGDTRFEPLESPPLTLPGNAPQQNPDSHFSLLIPRDLDEKSQGCRGVGFQNLFQSPYHPLRMNNQEPEDLGHQTGGVDYIHHSAHQEEAPDQHIGKVGQLSPATPNVYSTKITIQDATQVDINEHFGPGNADCCSNVNAPLRNEFVSNPEGEGSGSPNSLTNNRIDPLGSAWITRLSGKASGPMTNSIQSNLQKCAAIEESPEGQNPFPQCQRKRVQNSSEDCALSPSSSYVSKRSMVHADQKFKSKLHPILPSHRFKKSEVLASVFAKRLDAIKHTAVSEVADNTTRASLCFFCGMRGHSLKECSEALKPEHEELLKNVNQCDCEEESSCFCIHCFRLDHWAVSCSYGLKKKSLSITNDSMVNHDKCDGGQQNPGLIFTIDRSGGTLLHSENVDRTHQLVSDNRLDERTNNSGRAQYIIDNDKTEHAGSDGILGARGGASNLDAIKKDPPDYESCKMVAGKETSRDRLIYGKQMASCSGKNESRDDQIIPFYNCVTSQPPCTATKTFQAIRKLRISRTDIMKCIKLPISKLRLEGFFVRIKLGKCGGGVIGETGYYVARINGIYHEKSYEKRKSLLYVDIGDFKCSVDYRFVSNHDYLEEELDAWWSATLKAGCNPPSVEYLTSLLQLRERHGF